MRLTDRVIIVTGSSRGIGRAIALRLAAAGARVVVTGKSVVEGKLPGTIHSVAEEIAARGGTALPVPLDVRLDTSVAAMVERTVAAFGRVDALVNNAGAIALTPLEETPMKRVDLMMQINVRACLLCASVVLPHLKAAGGGHILNLSPPLGADPKWLNGKTPYTISKFGMTLATLGLAEELRAYRIAVNSLWPRTLIASAATRMLLGEGGLGACRTPEIMADAAYEILTSDPAGLTGQTLLDEPFLRSRGYTDFARYAVDATKEPALDLYIADRP